MLTLKEPVKACPSKGYLAVLEDADGVTHFWLPDGTYDGHDRRCQNTEPDKKEVKKSDS